MKFIREYYDDRAICDMTITFSKSQVHYIRRYMYTVGELQKAVINKVYSITQEKYSKYDVMNMFPSTSQHLFNSSTKKCIFSMQIKDFCKLPLNNFSFLVYIEFDNCT